MTAWWRRNRWALAALVLLVPLALLASSYRYFTIYQPVYDPPVTTAVDGVVRVDLDRRDAAGTGYRVAFTATLDQMRRSRESGVTVDVGAELWVADFTFEADPTSVISCESAVATDDRGRSFAAGVNVHSPGVALFRCVPADTPGPTLDFEGRLTAADVTRPERWSIRVLFAIPEGTPVTKVAFHVNGDQVVEFAVAS